MNNYIPFLKFKSNEVGAVQELDPAIRTQLSVFFEIPRIKDGDSVLYQNAIDKASKSIWKRCRDLNEIYLDSFDVPSDILIGKIDLYAYALNSFSKSRPIPVIGIDRSEQHNKAALQIKSDVICIRVQPADFDSFELFFPDFTDIVGITLAKAGVFDLVLDCRFCLELDPNTVSLQIVDFIKKANRNLKLRKIIVTGSSIPGSIGQIVPTNSEKHQHRNEVDIFKLVFKKQSLPNLFMGDYAVTSPLFVDLNILPEMMQNVMAPRLIYAVDGAHHIMRGGAIKTHRRKLRQFNDMCVELLAKSFFRGTGYSWGDDFLAEKCDDTGTRVTPSTIIKPTTNAHITFMLLK